MPLTTSSFYLRECLKRSEVESLVLGGTTFSAPDTANHTDATCQNNRSYDQILKWQNVTTNPLPAGQRVSVTVNFTDAAPTPLPTVATPSRPTLGTVTTSSISISWAAVTGAGSYQVQYKRTTASPWNGPHSVANGLTYTAAALQQGTEYEFQVRATGNGTTHNSATWSGWSSSRKATTTSAPTAPTTGSATVRATDGVLVLSWTGSQSADHYEVWIEDTTTAVAVYTANDVSGSPHAVPNSALSTLAGLQTAEVKACNSGGCSTALDISFLPPALAPASLRPTRVAKTEIDLSWGSAVATTGYEHDYRNVTDNGQWRDVVGSTTATTRTVTGLECEHEYAFRVRAYGDGTSYYSEWGPWSDAASATTEDCNEDPEFEHNTYAFRAAPASTAGTVVGNVRATDDVEVVSYSLSGSNLFSISKNNDGDGVIAVARTIPDDAESPVSLTATATDAEGATDTTTVTVTISATGPTDDAPAPTLSLESRDNTSITVSWGPVEGTDNYRAQHKISTADDYTGSITTQTITSYTAAGLLSGTSYDFHAASHGDGATYVAGWSDWSPDYTVTTTSPPPPGCENVLGTLSGPVIRTGTWAAGCDSTNRPGKYARYFTFTIAAQESVTIELVSRVDTYLFLLEGAGMDGDVIVYNDDSRDNELGRLNSRIVRSLAAGTYTAEATTYSSGRTRRLRDQDPRHLRGDT